MSSAFGIEHVHKSYAKNAARLKTSWVRVPGKTMPERMKWNYGLYRNGAGQVGAKLKRPPTEDELSQAREMKAYSQASQRGAIKSNKKNRRLP